MGIDSMRVGGGRCSSLLVGTFLVACLVLICNWWTATSENTELVRQIDKLSEELKISAEERDQCVTLRGNLEQRYKHAEDKVASLHVSLEQQTDLKKRNLELEDTINICRSELDSLNKLDATKTVTLNTLRLEKHTFNTQLDVQRDENKKLQEEIEQLKDELDKIKHTCNPTPNETPLVSQSQIKPKHQKNDSNGDLEDNLGSENSKPGNTGTTDGSVVGSGKDQHTNEGTIRD